MYLDIKFGKEKHLRSKVGKGLRHIMNSYYCCYWCYTVYDKKEVKENQEIKYHGSGFQILNGYCQGKYHQNRRSRCDLYGISNDFVLKFLNNKIYFKEERSLDFLNLCQKKMCGRQLWLKRKKYFD